MPNLKSAIKKPQLIIRQPENIYQIRGEIVNGTFHGRWYFSFGDRTFIPKQFHKSLFRNPEIG